MKPLFAIALFLTGCASYNPQGMQEIRYLEIVQNQKGPSRFIFKMIAGHDPLECKDRGKFVVCSPDAEGWRSVGEFENNQMVGWWQERDF